MKAIKALVVVSAVLVASCSTTVPVTAKFPSAPPELLKRCEELKLAPATGKITITDLLKTVVENYQLYYACSLRVEGWQEWHTKQQEIFNKVSEK